MDFSTAPNIALQASAPGLAIPMLLLSLLGSPEFYLVILPLLFWCYDKTLGLRLIILLSISVPVNAVFKILLHSPRPYWIDRGVQAFASEPTFGMPSAAAQVSVTFLGYIAAWFRKTWIWVTVIILVILVGVARMYLGVHFLGDVLSGWAIALVVLAVFLWSETPVAAWLSHKTALFKISCAFLGSLVLVSVAWLAVQGIGAWQVPAGWSSLALTQTGVAIDPVSLRDTLMAAGLLFGACAGAVIGSGYNPGPEGGTLQQKTLRYLAGIAVLALIWVALSAVTKTPGLPGYTMTYIRAALAGAWVTAGAPYMFGKTGLAGSVLH